MNEAGARPAGEREGGEKMRRGFVIVGALLVVLAAVGIGIGAYQAGEAHGAAQEVAATAEGAEVVHVVDGGGYRWGHAGFFPVGFLLFPLLVIGTVLLVRAASWRGGGPWLGGWGPGGFGPDAPRGPGFGPGAREEWVARAEDWHRSLHERGESATTDAPRSDPQR
jgi:hypothetical protein